MNWDAREPVGGKISTSSLEISWDDSGNLELSQPGASKQLVLEAITGIQLSWSLAEDLPKSFWGTFLARGKPKQRYWLHFELRARGFGKLRLSCLTDDVRWTASLPRYQLRGAEEVTLSALVDLVGQLQGFGVPLIRGEGESAEALKDSLEAGWWREPPRGEPLVALERELAPFGSFDWKEWERVELAAGGGRVKNWLGALFFKASPSALLVRLEKAEGNTHVIAVDDVDPSYLQALPIKAWDVDQLVYQASDLIEGVKALSQAGAEVVSAKGTAHKEVKIAQGDARRLRSSQSGAARWALYPFIFFIGQFLSRFVYTLGFVLHRFLPLELMWSILSVLGAAWTVTVVFSVPFFHPTYSLWVTETGFWVRRGFKRSFHSWQCLDLNQRKEGLEALVTKPSAHFMDADLAAFKAIAAADAPVMATRDWLRDKPTAILSWRVKRAAIVWLFAVVVFAFVKRTEFFGAFLFELGIL